MRERLIDKHARRLDVYLSNGLRLPLVAPSDSKHKRDLFPLTLTYIEVFRVAIRYDELYCEVCGERTSHVEIDDYDNEIGHVKRWQCEICGTKRK